MTCEGGDKMGKLDIDMPHNSPWCDECMRRFEHNEQGYIQLASCYVSAEGTGEEPEDVMTIDLCEKHYYSTYGSTVQRVLY